MSAFVSGIVLAAGSSTRYPGSLPKQLLRVEGVALLQRVATAALESCLAEVIVVLGHQADTIRRALPSGPIQTVLNPDHREGKSTSVRAGLAAVSPRASAAMFLQADQPYLSAAVLDRLVATFQRTSSPIVLPTFRSRRGSPVLFARALFEELAALRGDEGGRQILATHTDQIHEVELESERPLLDIDTDLDLRLVESQ